MLVLSRKKDEKIIIDDKIEITIVEIDNGRVKLGIKAPHDIEIIREELYRQVQEENIKAVMPEKMDINSFSSLNRIKKKDRKV